MNLDSFERDNLSGESKHYSVIGIRPGIEHTGIESRDISKMGRDKALVNISADCFVFNTYCVLITPSAWLFRT